MSCRLGIDKAVFEKLPGLKVFVAVVRDLSAASVDAAGCKEALCEAWQASRDLLKDLPTVQSHPRIASWRKAYAALGVPAKKYTSSIESLMKRAAKPDSEPRSINALVDFYNACSLRFVVPFGGFDLDDPEATSMDLQPTRVGDTFEALDATGPEPLSPGELAYVSGTKVLTRHINWKQSKEGLIKDSTQNVVFMAEILGDIPEAVVDEIVTFFQSQSRSLLGKEAACHVLTSENSQLVY